MGGRIGRQAIAVFMLVLFSISTQSYYFSNDSNVFDDKESTSSKVLGQEEKIAIGSYPDGAVEKVMISVPDGQVVQSMNLDIEGADLATSTSFSLTESVDFSSSNSGSLSLLFSSFRSIPNDDKSDSSFSSSGSIFLST